MGDVADAPGTTYGGLSPVHHCSIIVLRCKSGKVFTLDELGTAALLKTFFYLSNI